MQLRLRKALLKVIWIRKFKLARFALISFHLVTLSWFEKERLSVVKLG